MLKQQVRTAILCITLGLALVDLRAAFAEGTSTAMPATPLAVPEHHSSAEPASSCVRDPANLPQPIGPDGREANFLHTCGNRIYDAQGNEVLITGLAWSGMEYPHNVPGGLERRNWRELLDLIVVLGYNTVRIPFSSEAIEPGSQITGVDYTLNPDLEGLSGLEVLDLLVAGARERGLKVILDRHFVAAGRRTNLWYTEDVPESRWIADWRMLAKRYAGDDTVIGADLHNEPHGEATWGYGDPAVDWRLAAERAGNAVLEENPYWLIFVEGIETYKDDHGWWGGALQGVRTDPVRLRIPNRVVYSPHEYGPSVSPQPWFWDPRYPANLQEVWERQWAYVHHEELGPVVVGEFGGPSFGDDPDGKWQRTFLEYVRRYRMGAVVWSLNPSWDTGGILGGDWRTIDRVKQESYRPLLADPLDHGVLGMFGLAPSRYVVHVRREVHVTPLDQTTISFVIANEGPVPQNLGHFEIRYWLPSDAVAQQASSVQQLPAVGNPHTRVEVVAGEGDGSPPYIRVRFDPRAGTLRPYRTSEPVAVEVPLPLVSAAQASANSGDGVAAARWSGDRVALYLDGEIVWGEDP